MKSLLFVALFGFVACVLADDLPAGHPTVKDALEASGAQTQDSAASLTNLGTVVSTIDSAGYTYIEVEQEGKKVWLAASKVELAAGSPIRFGRGLPMTNFYSKSLQREFPEIFFVDRVEVVK
jgi:hypothetical protein